MDEAKHVSVLLNECIENLNIKPSGIYLDGTLGMGGHSYQIASRLTTGRLICIDRDETAIERAGKRLAPFADKITLVHGNFCDAAQILDSLNIPEVDGMLLTSVFHLHSLMKLGGAFLICTMRRWICAWIPKTA